MTKKRSELTPEQRQNADEHIQRCITDMYANTERAVHGKAIDKVNTFKHALVDLCRKHGFVLTHEDHEGDFVIMSRQELGLRLSLEKDDRLLHAIDEIGVCPARREKGSGLPYELPIGHEGKHRFLDQEWGREDK